MSSAFIQHDTLWLVFRNIIGSSIMTFHGGHQLQSCNLQHLTSDIILSLKESQLSRLEKWFNFRPNLGMELCTLRDKLYDSGKVTCQYYVTMYYIRQMADVLYPTWTLDISVIIKSYSLYSDKSKCPPPTWTTWSSWAASSATPASSSSASTPASPRNPPSVTSAQWRCCLANCGKQSLDSLLLHMIVQASSFYLLSSFEGVGADGGLHSVIRVDVLQDVASALHLHKCSAQQKGL